MQTQKKKKTLGKLISISQSMVFSVSQGSTDSLESRTDWNNNIICHLLSGLVNTLLGQATVECGVSLNETGVKTNLSVTSIVARKTVQDHM